MQPLQPPPPGEPGYFYGITNEAIYTALINLQGQVSVLVQQGTQSAKEIVDHETRLRVLERSRWPLPSIAVLVSLAAFVATFVR